ncbi:MAG: LysM peptidoglycan-binding domain-containing protein, partial [Bacillota bacterium]|nr:LysM peptidoglycan-binding domain-containing protein [Bacillota bacterium]
LYLISKKFNIKVESLMEANSLKSTLIFVGQTLIVPALSNPPAQLPTNERIPNQQLTSSRDDSSHRDAIEGINSSYELWNIPEGVVLHYIQSGESFWQLINRYRTSKEAIVATNKLNSNLLMINQPLFIPINSAIPVSIIPPSLQATPGFGQLLEWKYVSWLINPGSIVTIEDLQTGKKFQAYRLGGSNHADMEPYSAADTKVMSDIYGGRWSWEVRPVLVTVGDQVLAASISAMPHSIQTITNNNFNGHFDLYFLNSKTHNTNSLNTNHQAATKKAGGEN